MSLVADTLTKIFFNIGEMIFGYQFNSKRRRDNLKTPHFAEYNRGQMPVPCRSMILELI